MSWNATALSNCRSSSSEGVSTIVRTVNGAHLLRDNWSLSVKTWYMTGSKTKCFLYVKWRLKECSWELRTPASLKEQVTITGQVEVLDFFRWDN